MRQINKKYRNTTAVASKLAEDNVKIIYRVLYDKFKGATHDVLISIAMATLLDAAYKYDTTSNVKFTTYAYTVVYLKLLENLRNERDYENSRILCGDFSDEKLLTKEIKEFLGKYSNNGSVNVDFDGLQQLSDLGLYEMGWEMRHQELKGGRNVKPKDYKQAKIIKQESTDGR